MSSESGLPSSSDSQSVVTGPSEATASMAPKPLGVVFVLSTLVAAAMAFLIMFRWGSPLMIPKDLADLPASAPIEKLAIKDAAAVAMVRGNTLISFGILSALAGSVACGAARLSQSSFRKTITGALVGLVVLGGTGLLMVLLGLELRAKLQPLPEATLSQMAKTLSLHVAVWCGQGAAVGLCVAVQRGRGTAKVLHAISGALAGLIGGCLYSPIAAIAFPMEDTDRLIPTGFANGLCWTLFFYGLITVLLVALTKPAPKA